MQQVMQHAQQEWEVHALMMQEAIKQAHNASDAEGGSGTAAASSGEHTAHATLMDMSPSPMSPMTPMFATMNPFGMPLDSPAHMPLPPLPMLPSAGSALHGVGKCKPCAWFWKPSGCHNGAACAHCHLCLGGELKERKRTKESAMRLGGLTPARQNAAPRSPRVVKIAPSLGA